MARGRACTPFCVRRLLVQVLPPPVAHAMTHVVAFQPGSSIPTEVQRLVHQWVVIEAGSEVRVPFLLRPDEVAGRVGVCTWRV